MPIADLRASPENDRLYRPVDPADPAIQGLAVSIRQHGVREPLVVTEDGYIISGHRRFAAAKLAGLTVVPVRVEQMRRCDDPDRFLVLLREHNRQREKSRDERLREELISIDPDAAYTSLIERRSRLAEVTTPGLTIEGTKRRCRISAAKQPFLEAIQSFILGRKKYWPLSDRVVHYGMLNDPPLKHAGKPNSRYDNTHRSYDALTELLTRARLEGLVPMEAIADETRPVTVWEVFRETGSFLSAELEELLNGYWRDLLQSQPNHIEIVCEKNTVEPILRRVAMKYCIPLTSGRGYCSLPPRAAMARRYRQSGKEQFVLLMLTDFDPDGQEIAHSLARSMRDDFVVEKIHPIKVALNGEQVEEYHLPPQMEAKATSVHFKKFTERHGKHVFELEALAPDVLQQILQRAIDEVIDTEAFNAELDAEHQDAKFLEGVRTTVREALLEVGLGGGK